MTNSIQERTEDQARIRWRTWVGLVSLVVSREGVREGWKVGGFGGKGNSHLRIWRRRGDSIARRGICKGVSHMIRLSRMEQAAPGK